MNLLFSFWAIVMSFFSLVYHVISTNHGYDMACPKVEREHSDFTFLVSAVSVRDRSVSQTSQSFCSHHQYFTARGKTSSCICVLCKWLCTDFHYLSVPLQKTVCKKQLHKKVFNVQSLYSDLALLLCLIFILYY